MDELTHLEKALVRNPFDVERRIELARALERAGETEASLEQWNLVQQQAGERAAGFEGAARCLVAQGDLDRARERWAEAKTKPDHRPDPQVEAATEGRVAVEAAAPVRPLSVVAGGAKASSADVLPLRSEHKVRFVDVVGMEALKKTIRLRVVDPFENPSIFERFRKRSGGGVMLFGPPGCGKTMIARAIATECQATFTSVGISDVLNMWHGESERQLGAIFEKARADAPSVLFFDELDALAYSRSKAQSDSTRTLVNEFLAQLDGLHGDNEKVLFVAATNMPWDVDDAMKRPGRFDRQIFVPPPDVEARAEMFRQKLVGVPIGDLDFLELGRATEHCSGADIDGIIDQAKEEVLDAVIQGDEDRVITQEDLLGAAEQSDPSTLDWLKTAKTLVKYGGRNPAYKEVEKYLRSARLF